MTTEPLSPGDTIDYSVSYFVRQGPEEAWVKFGASSTVRDGESTDEARFRLTDYVHAQLAEAIQEVKES